MRREIKIGVTLVLAIALFYFSMLWLKKGGLRGTNDNNYTIHFEHVAGLLENDPVMVRGYAAGRVLEITPEPSYIAVKIALRNDIVLYQDAVAEIQPKELMGGKQIDLNLGMGPEKLKKGEPLRGQASLDFSSGFSLFGKMVEKAPTDQALQILSRIDTFSRVLPEISAAIDAQRLSNLTLQALERIERILQSIEQKGLVEQTSNTLTETQSLINKGNRLVNELNQSIDSTFIQNLQTSVSRLALLFEKLDKMADKGDAFLTSIDGKDQLAYKVLSDPVFAKRVDSLVYHLDQVLTQIHTDKIIVGLRRKKK